MELGEEIDTFPSDSTTGIIGFSPCGQYLTCSGKEEVLYWDITRREPGLTWLNEASIGGVIEFSPSGSCLAYNGDEKFMYDLTQRKIHAKLSIPQECEYLETPVFSSCGQDLANWDSWNEVLKNVPIWLWEAASGKHLATFRGHSTDVLTLTFSPDNKLLASASHDGTILLWDLTPYL